MGLLDELNLGGALKGALGQIEASAGPTVINALLAKTQFGDLSVRPRINATGFWDLD